VDNLLIFGGFYGNRLACPVSGYLIAFFCVFYLNHKSLENGLPTIWRRVGFGGSSSHLLTPAPCAAEGSSSTEERGRGRGRV